MALTRNLTSVLAMAAVATTSAWASDESKELTLGAPAPALSIKRWIKGKPLAKFDARKTYVIEFWATWCGPCKSAMPHLSELARKNKDVTFIGVGIWEHDAEGKIDAFVKDMGDKMDYNVAYSGNQDGMAASWMKAFGRPSIPATFIVRGGKVQWMGGPLEMDKPLAEIKSGTFKIETYLAELTEQAKESKRIKESFDERVAIEAKYEAGQRDEAKADLVAFEKKHPKEPFAAEIRFGWLAMEDPAAWRLRPRNGSLGAISFPCSSSPTFAAKRKKHLSLPARRSALR
ncbi:TlpA family protein disulfide reductase [bacterium]|nr:MAG: TlpA family protein disulfide reductase [bacterium]